MLAFTSPNTEGIKQAEAFLKVYWKHVQCIPVLLGLMKSSAHISVRQLSAVLLRKRINVLWIHLDDAAKTMVKTAVLESMAEEEVQLVRKVEANLAAALAKHLLGAGEWNELLQFIERTHSSPNVEHQELTFVLLLALTETVADHLKAHFGTLKNLFASGLQNQNPKVRTAALRASSSLVEYLSSESEVVQFRELVPLMIAALQHCVAAGEEETAVLSLDVFQELAESPVPVLTPSLNLLVGFCLEVCGNAHLDPSTRDAAGMVLQSLMAGKPKALGKAGLTANIMSTMVQVMASSKMPSFYAAEEDDDDEEEVKPYTMAQSCIDDLCMNIPSKFSLEPVLNCAVTAMQSPNPGLRRAGCAAAGVASEGLAEVMVDRLGDLLQLVYQTAADADPTVRESAAFCLGQWSEYLQPHILDHHSRILPVVFALLNDATPRVQGASCYVLESFCENMTREQILPYLQPLMTRLVEMLQSMPIKQQEMCIAAISASAIAAEHDFVPYLPATARMMLQMMQLTDERQIGLRGRATECLGLCAAAVGKEVFQPYLAETMTAAGQNLQLESAELHEYAYGLFTNVSKALEEDFTAYLPQLVPHLTQAAMQSDGSVRERRGGDENGGPSLAGLTADDSDSDSEGEAGAGRMTISVRTAVLDAKTAAVTALGALADHCGAGFAPFAAECIEKTMDLAEYFHENVRESLASALGHMVLSMHKAAPAVPPHPEVQKHADAVVQLCVIMMGDDDDRSVVSSCCATVSLLLSEVGPHSVRGSLAELMAVMLELLAEGTCCQQTAEEEEEEDGEHGDHDNLLIDSVADLVGHAAKAMGPDFAPFFRQLCPPLLKFTKSARPATSRSMAVGCFAEVFDYIGPACAEYLDQVVPVVVRGLADSHHFIQRNSAYCAGVIVAQSGAAGAAHVPTMLRALHPLFTLQPRSAVTADVEAASAVRDNAAAAVARMITAGAQLPFAQVIPVFLGALPLQEDHSEDGTVYGCLAGLLTSSSAEAQAVIQPHVPAAVSVCARALAVKEVAEDEEVVATIVGALKHLLTTARPQLEALVAALPEEERATLTAALQ